MAFELPQLPYPKDALAPVMSVETLDFHHGKHHRAYVDNLNKLVTGTDNERKTLEELVKTTTGPTFNNAAQVWNHTFFWNSMSPRGGHLQPGRLNDAIRAQFGSLENFKEKFTDASVKQFGSGWGWLVKDAQGKLSIVTTSNAGNPLVDGLTPILTCDVWEHAYYIDYRNRRPEFLAAFWKIVDWSFAEANFAAKG